MTADRDDHRPDRSSAERRRPWNRVRMAVGGLAAVAFAGSMATGKLLFPHYSINHDEPMYVLEARMLRAGHVLLPASRAQFFRPWAAGVRGDFIVLKYTPPWPSMIAAAQAFLGSNRVAPALVAAALVVVIYLLGQEVFGRRRAGLVAAALFALSPVVVVLSGTFLAYNFQLLIGVVFAYLVLSGLRLESAARLLGAGAAFGLAVFARPFDAVLMATPFAVLMVVTGRHELRAMLRRSLFVAAGALPLLAVTLAYNSHTMGSPWRFPFSATGKYDTLGFGRRGIFPNHTSDYDLSRAVRSLDNVWALPGWSFGGLIVVLLAVAGLAVTRPAGARRWAVAGIALTVPLGYFFFWSPYAIAHRWPGLASLGPFYHLPMLVPIVLFAGAALDRAMDRQSLRRLVGVLALAMVALTALGLPTKVSRNLDATQELGSVQREVAKVGAGRAVVFLPEGGNEGFASPAPFASDEFDLSRRVVYASDLGPENLSLVDGLLDRTPYLLHNEIPAGGQILSPHLTLTKLTIRRGASVVERLHLRNPGAGGCVVAYAQFGTDTRSVILDRASQVGATYDVDWTVAPAASDRSPFSIGVPAGAPTGEVKLGVGFGRSCALADVERYERRFPARVVTNEVPTLELLDPGPGWHQVRLPGRRPVWVPEHIDAVIAAQPHSTNGG